MNNELMTIFSDNSRYKEAYDEFLDMHKNGHGKNVTPEQLSAFEEYFARDFLNGIKNDSNERVELIRGERIVIRKANITDADFMSAVELDSDNSTWVGNWPLGWRIAKFGDKDFLQTIIEKGKGYGKEALLLAQKLAFDVLGTKYLYLTTRPANVRAQNIYKATGFTPEMPDYTSPSGQFIYATSNSLVVNLAQKEKIEIKNAHRGVIAIYDIEKKVMYGRYCSR